MISVPSSVVFDDVSWPNRPWFRSNILLDSSGNPAGPDGTSRSLTRGNDRHLLRALRQDAQAIVTGGETVRSEGWHFPPDGFLFVATRGDLSLDTCARPERLRLFTFDASSKSLENALSTLATECRVRRLLCESGPQLLRAITEADLIDEAFVSVVSSDRATEIHVDELEGVVRRALSLKPSRYALLGHVQQSDVTYFRFVHLGPRLSPVFGAM
ncbi:MAG: hypothetical protein ACOYKK_00380 [Microbacteriaceae bacterium]